ncbi:hypothetical protein [Sagittula stellata]|uniref:Peptidoglycan-binding protein n=1 Tax=Sagittula stellata (strain ATCC 700073 / DSM 11524 / E-37) TaxID=388399 RepID=A3JZW4_SAGS3|nr:hypothetical protein SSE37_22594 [Sagittula stellata E-37]
MSLSRRTGARFQANIWPGFVDAMTGLLLVLTFVLSIFMVIQFVLNETISGQENELDSLSSELSALAQALGVAERRNAELTSNVGDLEATLSSRDTQLDEAQSIITALTATRDRQAEQLEAASGRISDFEAQVAALILERDSAQSRVIDLTQARDDLTAAFAPGIVPTRTASDAGPGAAMRCQ